MQLDAVRAITSFLQSQQSKSQSKKGKNIIQFQIQEQIQEQTQEQTQEQGSEQPKTYHEYLLQQQKQHELIEAAKTEALEAAKNYAMKSGQSKIAIKPVKLIQLVSGKLRGEQQQQQQQQQVNVGQQQQQQVNVGQQQQQQVNVGQQYLQQTFNDISSATEESRNMPVVFQGSRDQIRFNQARRLRRPVQSYQGSGEVLEVQGSSQGSQNPEIQFIRLPVQESPSGGEEYESPNVPVTESDQVHFQHQPNDQMIQFQQGLTQQQQLLLSALESAPRPPLPPHVSLAPEVTFIQRPSATVAFFPPTLSAVPPGYHGLDTSSTAHHSSHIQGSQRPDPVLGHYEFVGQSPAPQIPVHLLMQQQFGQGQVPSHLLHHQAHITHQLHPHHPGGRLVKTVLIKEQVEHINPGQQIVHHHHGHHQQPVVNSPVTPVRAPITGYGMHGWIPKDVPNDWTPGGPFRSAAHSYNDEIKFTPFDRITTKPPLDLVQINHHWSPSSDKTIQALTSTPVTERPSVVKPTDSEPATPALEQEAKDEKRKDEKRKDEKPRDEKPSSYGEEEEKPKDLATESSVKNTKPAASISDKYVNQKPRHFVKPVVRVTPSTTTVASTSTESPGFKEEDVHVGIVEDGDELNKSTHVESLKESSSGVAIEVIPSTKRHLFERIVSTTPIVVPSSSAIVTSTTTSTTTTTPRPTTTVGVESSTVKDKISRRNSPSIVLSSIDIELGPKGHRRPSALTSAASTFLANLDKKVGLIKDLSWEQN